MIPSPPVQATPSLKTPLQIAPEQLWIQLTPLQQQHVHQALIAIGEHLLSVSGHHLSLEEHTDER